MPDLGVVEPVHLLGEYVVVRVAPVPVAAGALTVCLTRDSPGTVIFCYTRDSRTPPTASTPRLIGGPVTARGRSVPPVLLRGLWYEARRPTVLRAPSATCADNNPTLLLAGGLDPPGNAQVVPAGKAPLPRGPGTGHVGPRAP